MKKRPNRVLTIGHSNHTLEFFLELLTQHRVTALADVRSAPYSRFNPHFNREQFAKSLGATGIRYVFLGRELGGRSDDPSRYDQGRLRYERLAGTPGFHEGLRRVMRGAEEYRIALMCAEKDPLHCHRSLLVGHQLNERGVEVAHILADGRLEPHATTMDRLLAEFKLVPENDLFRRQGTHDELVSEAIARQSDRVGHAIAQVPDSPGAERVMKVSTIGFTRKSAQRFFQLLRDARVRRIVDVRLHNSSQLAGFAKKDDLAWFARELCGIDYIHVPDLAPTKELLSDYRQGRIGWEAYEARFIELMEERRVESVLSREVVSEGCLLCSEDQPHHCHRRLIAEYLNERWGELEIRHLGLKDGLRTTPDF